MHDFQPVSNRGLEVAAFHAFLLFALMVATTAEGAPRVGVLDLSSESVSRADLSLLSDRLRIELFNTGEYQIIERERMDAILAEQGFQKSGCVATECVVEIGQLTGAEKMVAGTVGRIGRTYTIALRVINVETGAIERTAVEDCAGCTLEDLLTTGLASVAARLAGTVPVVSTPLNAEEGFGLLYVASEPSGAVVYLDGRKLDRVTPLTLEGVAAGEHILRLTNGDLLAEYRVRVKRDELTRTNLVLQRARGSLFVDSSPPEANVTFDGKAVGRTPVFLNDVPCGRHGLEVSREHYSLFRDSVEVAYQRRAAVSAVLKPVGYLDINVNLSGASAIIDDSLSVPNVAAGRASERGNRVQLPPGEHRVVLSKPDYDSSAHTVVIQHGRVTVVDAALTYRFGSVRILSNPSGASVMSSPPAVEGVTPLTANRIPPGRYRLMIRREERAPYERTIDVIADQTAVIDAELPLHPDIVRAQRARMTARVRWTSAALGAGLAIAAYAYHRRAEDAYSKGDAAYSDYEQARTTEEAVRWRDAFRAADARGDRAELRRNVLYGLAGVAFGVGVAFTIR